MKWETGIVDRGETTVERVECTHTLDPVVDEFMGLAVRFNNEAPCLGTHDLLFGQAIVWLCLLDSFNRLDALSAVKA